ncbi:hypothetical protein QAD02_008275 [Eretmocerus hayati]|uniref:Uncharacterized protein n=1 Tax=Eretmocerus hayati TaxID=131215 RepID=A0ACC2N6L4_9HYME|nr:hypothetical protein QAD02_008275 [Eretmocerus hayati]
MSDSDEEIDVVGLGTVTHSTPAARLGPIGRVVNRQASSEDEQWMQVMDAEAQRVCQEVQAAADAVISAPDPWRRSTENTLEHLEHRCASLELNKVEPVIASTTISSNIKKDAPGLGKYKAEVLQPSGKIRTRNDNRADPPYIQQSSSPSFQQRQIPGLIFFGLQQKHEEIAKPLNLSIKSRTQVPTSVIFKRHQEKPPIAPKSMLRNYLLDKASRPTRQVAATITSGSLQKSSTPSRPARQAPATITSGSLQESSTPSGPIRQAPTYITSGSLQDFYTKQGPHYEIRKVIAGQHPQLPVCSPAPGVLMGVRPWKQLMAPTNAEQRQIYEAIKNGTLSTETCVSVDSIKVKHRTRDIWVSPNRLVWYCDDCNKRYPQACNNWIGWKRHQIHQLGRQDILKDWTSKMLCGMCGEPTGEVASFDGCVECGFLSNSHWGDINIGYLIFESEEDRGPCPCDRPYLPPTIF